MFFSARAANAQAAPPVTYGFMFGGENATGNFHSPGGTAIGGVAGVELHVPLAASRFALRGDALYHAHIPLAGGAFYSDMHPSTGLARTGLQGGIGFEFRPETRSVLFAEWRYMGMGAGGLRPVAIGMRF